MGGGEGAVGKYSHAWCDHLGQVRLRLRAQSAAQAAGSAYSAEQLVEKTWMAVYTFDEGVLKPGDPSRLIAQVFRRPALSSSNWQQNWGSGWFPDP